MDLLCANYEDAESSSNSLIDKKNEQNQKGVSSKEASSSLQAEWESFEAMIGGTGGMSKENLGGVNMMSDVVTYPGLNIPLPGETNPTVIKQNSVEEPRKRKYTEDSNDDKDNNSHRSRGSSASSRSSSRSSSSSVERKSSKDNKSPSRRISTTSTGSLNSPKRERSRSPSVKKSVTPEKKKSKSRSKSPLDRKKKSRSRSPKRRRSRSRSKSRRRSSRSRHSRRRRSSRDRRRRSSKSRRHRRSRSRDRHGKSRRSSRDRRRHRDHKRRSRSRTSRDRKRSHRSRSRSRDRKHRRSRTRSRTRSKERYRSPVRSDLKPVTFKEQMRQELLKAGKILHNEDVKTSSDKPVQIPLSTKEFLKTISVSAAATGVTPQMALLETMTAMHKNAQEITGVPVPKYYNPAAVNPLKYAEQVQKRKLLWSKAKDHKEEKEKEWQGSTFIADQDGKTSAKFRKLMGIKEGEGAEDHHGAIEELTEEQKRRQAELFSRLDQEYEFARMTTHTQRGVGLGFSSHPIYPAGSGGGGGGTGTT